ncbi:MAG: ABC transporter ATP-binding protein [Thermoplasmatota archaeon]
MLDVDHVSFAYNGGPPVLDDVSFSVQPGQLCGLFGPNGCGKTTLFKCCLRFLDIQRGDISIGGERLDGKTIRELARLVAYVPQEHMPSFSFPVRDIVLMGRSPHLGGIFGVSKKDREITMESMRVIGIEEIADTPYTQLSVGQRQLVIIARAVAQETKLLFLDEPTSALDFSNQIRVWKLLRDIAHMGKTVVACTHDPNHVIWFCDHVVVMGHDGIVAAGPPAEIISEHVLDQIYGDVCAVKQVDQMKMVFPGQKYISHINR